MLWQASRRFAHLLSNSAWSHKVRRLFSRSRWWNFRSSSFWMSTTNRTEKAALTSALPERTVSLDWLQRSCWHIWLAQKQNRTARSFLVRGRVIKPPWFLNLLKRWSGYHLSCQRLCGKYQASRCWSIWFATLNTSPLVWIQGLRTGFLRDWLFLMKLVRCAVPPIHLYKLSKRRMMNHSLFRSLLKLPRITTPKWFIDRPSPFRAIPLNSNRQKFLSEGNSLCRPD